MKHIMIDLETLGIQADAAIIAIAAVEFDPVTGESEAQFYTEISRESCWALGMSVSQSTLDWWAKQGPEAQAVLDPLYPFTITKALTELSDFIKDVVQADDITIWAHGSFDPVLLDSAYNKIKVKTPWPYWAPKDIRTLQYLAGKVDVGEFVGTSHKAIDDCYHQIKYVTAMLAKVKL